MRIFDDALVMVKEVERDLFEMGLEVPSSTVQDKQVKNNPDYIMKELFGYSYALTQPNNLHNMVEYLSGNIHWCDAEHAERVSSKYIENPGTAWYLDPTFWKKYLHDGKFAYTYPGRIWFQLSPILAELQKNPSTRQAVITIYDQHLDISNIGGKKRVPCSMHYQFFIRQEKLSMIYSMRSCDFLNHFVHDVYLGYHLLMHAANKLGIPVGIFMHHIGSLHAFKGNLAERGIF